MAFIERIILIGIILCLAPRKGCCDSTVQPGCSQCPGPAVPDLSAPLVRKSYLGNLTARIWATGAMVPQTPLISEMRDVLLEMSASDSIYFSRAAFMHAAWSVALISDPNLYISLCPLAKVINDSLAYEKYQQEQTYLQMFYDIANIFPNACVGVTFSSLAQTGCADLSNRSEFPRNCYDNGMVFCAEEAWNQFGRLMPWTLTDVYFRLYNSKIFLERAHATILTFVMTPAQLQLFSKHSVDLFVQTLDIFVESPDVSRCCCSCEKSRLDELCVLHIQMAHANAVSEANGENCD